MRELQNIGNYCVWLYTDSLPSATELRQTQALFANMLNDIPADLAKRLRPLIPEEWTLQAEQAYTAELAAWKAEGEGLLERLEPLNARQAVLLEELRPHHAALMEALRTHKDELAKAIATHDMVLGYGDGRKATAEEALERLRRPAGARGEVRAAAGAEDGARSAAGPGEPAGAAGGGDQGDGPV